MMCTKKSIAVAVLATIAWPNLVGAAQLTERVIAENVYVYGNRTDLLATNISAAQGRVGSAEIDNRASLRTGEILEFVPGMVVTQHSGSGKANQYFLRGFNLDHGTDFATSIDTMPVNMRSHGHGQGYTDLNFIIPELIQTIDYRKGPYYAQVGDFSGAGSAEFTLKNSLPASELSFTTGDYDYRRVYAGHQVDLQSGKLVLGIEAQTYAGPWADIQEDVRKTNLLLRYSSELAGGDFSLTAMAYNNRWNSADQIPQRAITQGVVDRLGSLDTDPGGESSRYSVSAQWSNQDWTMSGYLVDTDLNLFSNFTYFLDDPINGDEFEQVDARQLMGGELARRWQTDLAGMTLSNQLGVQVRRDHIGELGLYKTRARERLSSTRVDQVDETSVALFAQSDLQLNQQWRAHLGLRHDYLRATVNSDLAQNSGSASDGISNLKAGLIYSFNQHLESYFNLGQGFHSNDARGATIVLDPVSGELTEPVDLLSRSQGAELGLKLFDRKAYNLSASLWYLQLDSELLFVGDAGNTEASRASERSGIELASYFWFANGWSLDTELAWSQSRFTDAQATEGKYVDGSVPFVASLGITYAPTQTGLHSSLRYRYFGARHLDSAGLRGSATGLVNLGLGYRWPQLSARLDLFNLFDSRDSDIEYFYASRLAGEPEAGIEDVHLHPVEPRSLRLNLDYHF